jgi:hypothetical protein
MAGTGPVAFLPRGGFVKRTRLPTGDVALRREPGRVPRSKRRAGRQQVPDQLRHGFDNGPRLRRYTKRRPPRLGVGKKIGRQTGHELRAPRRSRTGKSPTRPNPRGKTVGRRRSPARSHRPLHGTSGPRRLRLRRPRGRRPHAVGRSSVASGIERRANYVARADHRIRARRSGNEARTRCLNSTRRPSRRPERPRGRGPRWSPAASPTP